MSDFSMWNFLMGWEEHCWGNSVICCFRIFFFRGVGKTVIFFSMNWEI